MILNWTGSWDKMYHWSIFMLHSKSRVSTTVNRSKKQFYYHAIQLN